MPTVSPIFVGNDATCHIKRTVFIIHLNTNDVELFGAVADVSISFICMEDGLLKIFQMLFLLFAAAVAVAAVRPSVFGVACVFCAFVMGFFREGGLVMA